MIVLSESVISIKSFFAFFVLMIFMFTTSLIIQGKIRRRWNYFSTLKPDELTYSQDLYKKIPKEDLGIILQLFSLFKRLKILIKNCY